MALGREIADKRGISGSLHPRGLLPGVAGKLDVANYDHFSCFHKKETNQGLVRKLTESPG